MKTALSVVIPIKDQWSQLQVVLNFFSMQSLSKDFYEIIVVDDGSNDDIIAQTSELLSQKYRLNINLIHQVNMGRSCARNTGVKMANGTHIVFCDGDRIPCYNFLEKYYFWIKNKKAIVGMPLDYFGTQNNLENYTLDHIKKFSRIPYYYKKTNDLFLENDTAISVWRWLGFLVGNSCIQKNLIHELGGFSTTFKEWGFEHFEFAYRMQQKGEFFFRDTSIESYHIVHRRTSDFYNSHISKSIEIFCDLHPEMNKEKLDVFFLSKDERYNINSLSNI